MTSVPRNKTMGIIIKESGIILNYLVLMIGLYVWDLKAFYIILSFVCEYAVVMLIVMVLNLWSGKSRLINLMTFLEVLFGGAVLVGLQGLLLFFIANQYQQTSGWDECIRSLTWTIPAISLPMLFFHLLPLRSVPNKQRLSIKRTNLFTISVGFIGMSFVGLLTMELADPNSVKPIMVVMILGRMTLEIYMNHFQKDEPKKKAIQ